MRITHYRSTPNPLPNSPAVPLPRYILAPQIPLCAACASQIQVVVLTYNIDDERGVLGAKKLFSLPSAECERVGRTANAFNRTYPGFEGPAQLGQTVMLGHGTLDDSVPDLGTVGRDRDRKGVADPARLRLLAALGRSDLGEEHP